MHFEKYVVVHFNVNVKVYVESLVRYVDVIRKNIFVKVVT